MAATMSVGSNCSPGSVWLRIEAAAHHLDTTPAALRRALERAAHRVADGGTEAELDGIRARKLGRRWRVLLGPAWSGTGTNP